jgi:hypothetical protein
MKLLLLGRQDAALRRVLVERLEHHGHQVEDYWDIWRTVTGGRARRSAIVEAAKRVEGVVLDVTDQSVGPAAGMLVGVAATLKRPFLTIADASADHPSAANVSLRYAAADPEAMDLFWLRMGERLTQLASGSGSQESPRPQPKVFISYSHADREALARLRVHLRPLEQSAKIVCWDDEQIRPGDLWRDEIEAALLEASVAVLLVSPDFLASDFIVRNELPPLLKKAQAEGCRILPIVLRSCRFLREPHLSVFQAVNDPRRPLATMPDWERDEYYDKVAHAVEDLVVTEA